MSHECDCQYCTHEDEPEVELWGPWGQMFPDPPSKFELLLRDIYVPSIVEQMNSPMLLTRFLANGST